MRTHLALALLVFPAVARAQSASADWPVYGGTTDNTHYSTLSQITPANVARLRVGMDLRHPRRLQGLGDADEPGRRRRVLYATSPKLRVFALDAATGRELWSFDPNFGRPPVSRFRHRGLVVTGDRVLVTYRNKLWALDKTTGKPILSFGDSGAVDMRNGFDRPPERITISASTPGVVFGDLYIIGSTVAEALPSSPGDIRAYDVKTGAFVGRFTPFPTLGSSGYDTWSPDAWKVSGGRERLGRRDGRPAARHRVRRDRFGRVTISTGANRLGDNLFANTLLALDARTGQANLAFPGGEARPCGIGISPPRQRW